MSARIQQLIVGLGKAKQADIATASASFLRFKKLNMEATSPMFNTEDDSAESGKGHEFATAVYNVSQDVGNRIEKFATAEFCAWAVAYGLGNVVQTGSGPYVLTCTPIDAGTTLELPYFSVAEQLAEGGGQAIDNLYTGCAIEDFLFSFNSGPGRQSAKMTVNWVGSGSITTPSAVSIPALTTEKHMLAASMAFTMNGVNYVTGGRPISGQMGMKNNLLLNAGFFPGSGLQNGAAIRGRLEIGPRVPTFQVTVRLKSSSDEYAKLIAQTTGTSVLSVNFDSNNSLQFTWQQISYRMVQQAEADGIVAVTVTVGPQYHATNGLLTVVAKTTIAGIAQ